MKFFKKIPVIVYALLLLGVINYIASLSYERLDLTQDKRYTLSNPAKEILDQIKSPLIIDIFLEGEFPSEFRKLQNETRFLLEEINDYNSNISFIFSNPVEEGSDPEQIAQQFLNLG